MSRAEDIARKLWREYEDDLKPLVPLVAAALDSYAKEEREWCAKILDEIAASLDLDSTELRVVEMIAARIREGGEVLHTLDPQREADIAAFHKLPPTISSVYYCRRCGETHESPRMERAQCKGRVKED